MCGGKGFVVFGVLFVVVDFVCLFCYVCFLCVFVFWRFGVGFFVVVFCWFLIL